MSGNPSYTATCVQSEFGGLPCTLAFLLYTLTPLYYPHVPSERVRRHPSSATSEFAAWRCLMWRKAEANKPQPSPDATPSSVPSPQRPADAAPSVSPNAPGCVSHGIRIKGEISGQGDFCLDGEFEGKIRIGDGSFTVGPNARVSAEIEAREIIVHGEVIGTLKGERVQVSRTGRATGDMETRGIVIEDGAVLRSKVQGRQEDQPAQLSPPAGGPRAIEAADPAGGAAKQRERGRRGVFCGWNISGLLV